jgi:FkbM family methyltransferase
MINIETLIELLDIKKEDYDRAIVSEVFYNLPLHNKALHIGGHLGKEYSFYKDVVFVEPQPKYAEFLRKQNYKVIEGAVCGDEIFITSYDQASSVLEPLDHKVVSKIKVKNYTLDDINDGSFDMLVMDVQGSEYDILKSGNLTFNYIILEASERPRYQCAATKKQIEEYLDLSGYKKINEYKHGKYDIYDIIFEKVI